jgi:hypothetical protein
MVGRIKISVQAERVRQLFMEFEKAAKKIKTCCFCGAPWPSMKFANQGYLKGNHAKGCPFEDLAEAGEQCIITRHDSQQLKDQAEKNLSEKVGALFARLTEDVVPTCPFPDCNYPFQLGHRMGCPLGSLRASRPRL